MVWEFAGFIFFSTLEGIAIFSLMMSIFRLKATRVIRQALFIIMIMNLQSFVLREELSYEYLVPIINILLFILLLKTVVKIPILWSAIITCVGYFIYVVIQSLLVPTLFAGYELTEIQSSVGLGYALQAASAFIGIGIAWLLYRLGKGYIADFEKLNFNFEQLLVLIAFFALLIFAAIFLYFNQIWLNIIYFTAASLFFIYYSNKKEGY